MSLSKLELLTLKKENDLWKKKESCIRLYKRILFIGQLLWFLRINTFTANYELSRSPWFLYFCQLQDNLYFRDPLFLPTMSYLVVTKFIIFANYEITCTTLFLIFHLFTQKRMDFIIFVGKLKTQRILIRVFQTFLKKHFLYCHATRYLVVQNMGSLKSAW